MNQAVDTFISLASSEIKDKLPNFNKFYSDFKLRNLKTLSLLQTQQKDGTGYAANKKEIHNKLIAMAVDISHKLVAFADQSNNIVLLYQSKFSKRKLLLCSAIRSYTYCRIIHDAAEKFLPELHRYNLTQELFSEYSILLQNFIKAASQPRSERSIAKGITRQIESGLKISDIILAKMDILVNTIQISHPEFHKNYTAARVLNRPTYKLLSARGTIKDANGEPIPRVKMSCPELGIERKLPKSGNFKLSNIPEGDYILTFEKVPFQTQNTTFNSSPNNRTELTIIMNEL